MDIKGLKAEEECGLWIEYWIEYFTERADKLEDRFLADFYMQCAQSVGADAYEVFLETPLEYNYFRNNIKRTDKRVMLRFFKLAAIYHTLRAVKRRKKELSWDKQRQALYEIFELTDNEKSMTELFESCIILYQGGFQELFIKATPRYLFGDRSISAFSFAFIGNFWYNSYSSFMGSFSCYVPFHIGMERAAAQ